MIRIAVRILIAGIALVVFRHGNGDALPLMQGTVTFTTSRSVYVLMEHLPAVTENDSIPAGIDSGALVFARVKAVSNSSLVLERVPSLAGAEKGSTVYVQADIAPRKTSGGAVPTGAVASGQSGKASNPIQLDGYASIQYFRYRENGRKWEFDQPSFYTNARMGKLSGLPLSLNLRFRTSMMRDLVLPVGRKKSSILSDRLYDLSMEYGNPESGYISFGRMRTVQAGGMGGLDGMVVQRVLVPNLVVGLFTGVVPEMDSFIGNRKAIKKGAYLRWKRSSPGGLLMDMTASYLTKDASDLPPMHLLYLEQTFSNGSSFFMNQEVSLNLKPRGESRESKILQDVRSSVSFSPSGRICFRGSYFGYLVPDYGEYYRSLDPIEVLKYTHTHSFMRWWS